MARTGTELITDVTVLLSADSQDHVFGVHSWAFACTVIIHSQPLGMHHHLSKQCNSSRRATSQDDGSTEKPSQSCRRSRKRKQMAPQSVLHDRKL